MTEPIPDFHFHVSVNTIWGHDTAESLLEMLDELLGRHGDDGRMIDVSIAREPEPRPDLLALLRGFEWASTVWTDTQCCPSCRGLHPSEGPRRDGKPEDRGHEPDCKLALAIGAPRRSE